MITYIDEIHTYLNSDGVIIPSVSQLVNFATGDDYSIIPAEVLKKAQDFGTDIHDAIEQYIKYKKMPEFDDIKKKLAFEEFLRLKDEFISPVAFVEMMVDYQERFAGRLDCLTNTKVNGEPKCVLIDFKTNSKVNIPHLQYQLAFYKLALKQKEINVDLTYCLWLPKGKAGQWIEIEPVSEEKALEVLRRYEEHNSKD